MNVSKCFAKQRTQCSVKIVILSWIIYSCLLEAGGDNLSCETYKVVLDKKGLSDLVHKEPTRTQGVDVSICGKEGRKCCSANAEMLLMGESKKDFNKSVKTTLSQLGNILATRVTRFDDFFKKLLSESKRDFDAMFQKTYGVIYRQNSYVFTDLFEELERYYSKGQVDLEEALENFFNTLYQKMFTVLNSQYQFDDKYLECIGDHMKALEPFGDVPQKLSVQIKRSFVATRTFAQALSVARDVVEKMENLGPAGDCSKAVARMTYCPVCRGLPDVKPCGTLCLNIAKGCLAYHSALDLEWNNFVEAMDKVSDRLLGPFNIEVVVDPIDIKISEAIMNFQENAHDVSEKVFNGCGRLQLARHRRSSRELELETYQFSKEETKQPTLEKLIKDIRQKVKDSKSFWTSLPYQMCIDDKVVAPAKDNNCWNGTRIARYNRRVWDNGLSSQQTNPEVTVDTNRQRSVLNEQIYTLKMVTSKLKNAYNGLDVNWIDNEGSFNEDVGSGSGPEYGSGDGSLEHEGSGHGSSDYDDNDDDEGGDDDEEGEEPPVERKPPKAPISPNNESNHIPTSTDHGSGVDHTRVRATNSASSTRNHLVLVKAVASYLLPICVVWLGGILSDWL